MSHNLGQDDVIPDKFYALCNVAGETPTLGPYPTIERAKEAGTKSLPIFGIYMQDKTGRYIPVENSVWGYAKPIEKKRKVA
jgi:hypothetical protein